MPRSPRDFFKPKVVGAPEPLREIPVRPSRMIHFRPRSQGAAALRPWRPCSAARLQA